MFKTDYSEMYNELYSEKPYREEVDFIIGLTEEFGLEFFNVLDLGCGTGGHAKIFIEKGKEVTGVERSKEMINNSFSHLKFHIENADILDYRPQLKFDLIVSLFHVVSYVKSLSDLLKLFRNVSAGLVEDGLFIFDAWYTPAVLSIGPSSRINTKEKGRFRLERVSYPVNRTEESCVEVNFETRIFKNEDLVETITESHEMRHYSIPELKFIASLTDLELVEARELLTNNVPSQETWAVLFTFRKIKR